MIISIDMLVTVFLTILGAIIGALWGHHGQIKDRVSRSECQHNRDKCPCVSDLKDIKEKLSNEKD